MVGGWIAQRPFKEVIAKFEEAQAAVAPIYDIRDIYDDPQFQALESITTVEDPDLGPIKMQNVMFRLMETPGSVRWAGRSIGADNAEVYRELLGINDDRLKEISEKGIV
jgi:crotonobetainyl-CoA:carnitine CoA-transferase CaiB-like acyl-CoA transferase